MYRYDEFDHAAVSQRVNQFRGQVARHLSGELSDDEFRPLRLMNGLYSQLHAYMLRVAIPYGTLSSRQLRALAGIARKYDKGYAHFTTRQNVQFNWPTLQDTPDILADLADVEMHAIQTSGNCIRNVTADQYAGVAVDEVTDPRIYSEILRQWSTFHPEFSYLPRKFKIAVTASRGRDRTAVRFHDIGIRVHRNNAGEIGFEIMAGGGLGRTPVVAATLNEFVPEADLLSYCEAIVRVYNMIGRRDNLYKSRIKILVSALGAAEFTRLVEEEWAAIRNTSLRLPSDDVERIRAYFAPPHYETLANPPPELAAQLEDDRDFAAWHRQNVARHRQPGYAIANLSLKPVGGVPGDATAEQMEAVADLAERYSAAEIRVTHEQNLVLAHVAQKDLVAVWQGLAAHGLASANVSLISDVVCCPGLDYCGLATARSIPVAQQISTRFAELQKAWDIGELRLNISGCINACGHHHAGHIGVLGVDKRNEEFYQITLGGNGEYDASIGEIIGPGLPGSEIVDAIERIVEAYLGIRESGERFLDTVRRTGIGPFKEAVYDPPQR
ncbi:MAG: nitrite/sulfite reductase [Proteobacteria bacterium]|nr:nitrite/sulfite reductase [Pseudomonadota bacterium]MDA1132027.1 nitrite/sulfite reductase [Pseudomonadota bacterium]